MEDNINIINEAELDQVAGGVNVANKKVKIVNVQNYCNVRSTPETTSKKNIIGKAYPNDTFTFYGWSGNWARVQFNSNKAYIHKDYVMVIE